VFEQIEGVSVRYVTCTTELQQPDIIILPGSKNTMGDLKWMRQNGLETAVKKKATNTLVFGICGGYQMLGEKISDPYRIEEGGEMRGMELLPVITVFHNKKTRIQVKAKFETLKGPFQELSGLDIEGYEIHMGQTTGCNEKGNAYGTYVHGIFDKGKIAVRLAQLLAKRKGITLEISDVMDYESFKEIQYDKLVETLRQYMDTESIYKILNEAKI